MAYFESASGLIRPAPIVRTMRGEGWAAVVFLFAGAARGLPKSFRPGVKKESACATANSRGRGNLIGHLRRRVNEINSNRFRQFNVNVGYRRPFTNSE